MISDKISKKHNVKYEPIFFISCNKLRNTSINPVLCKDEPLEAGVLAMNFLNDFLSQEQKDVIKLNENNDQILPKKLQEKVKIKSLAGTTLILKANSSVWRAETISIKTNIINACNKILGKIAVKTIRIE